jgi:hypothetical protein
MVAVSAPAKRLMSFDNLDLVYEPFPMGVSRAVFEPNYYEELVASFPPKELFGRKGSLGNKYALSEVTNPEAYARFIKDSAPWRRLYAYIKSDEFIADFLGVLATHNIDLGVAPTPFSLGRRIQEILSELKHFRFPARPRLVTSRFEYSIIPADGGFLEPHTDAPRKVTSIVIPFVRHGEWDPSFGGGTAMFRAKDFRQSFNLMNRQLRFEDVETIRTFQFEPNQAVMLIKTFNSLHGVEVMRGNGSDALRKSITININLG